MGCTSTRDQVYIPNENNQFPSLIIEETACQLQNIDAQLVPSACGYLFALNNFDQNGEKVDKLHKETDKPDDNAVEEVKRKIGEMEKGYKEGKIDEAQLKLKEIQALSLENNLNPSKFTNQNQRKRFISLTQRIKQQTQYLKTLQSQLQSSNWNQKSDNSITIKTKSSANNIKILIQGQTANQANSLIALFASFESSASILKFAQSSGELQREDMFNKIGKIRFDCPLCKKQEKYYAITVFDKLGKDQSVIISYRSLFQNTLLCERFNYWPKDNQNQAINIHNISLKLQKREESIKLSLLFEFQAFFKQIADWVLIQLFQNMALASFSKLLFESAPNSSPQTRSSTQSKSYSELRHHFAREANSPKK